MLVSRTKYGRSSIEEGLVDNDEKRVVRAGILDVISDMSVQLDRRSLGDLGSIWIAF